MEVPELYAVACAENPTNNKRGGVCFYYLNSPPPKGPNIQFLNECINFEIKIGGKVYNFLCLYRSPSKTCDTFETYTNNFDLVLDALTNNNPFLIITIGDFNA